jgi:hypothetical protein
MILVFKGEPTLLVTALGNLGKPVPCGHASVEMETLMGVCRARHCAGQLGETGPPRPYQCRDEDPDKGSAMLVTMLGSWERPVPRGHLRRCWQGGVCKMWTPEKWSPFDFEVGSHL